MVAPSHSQEGGSLSALMSFPARDCDAWGGASVQIGLAPLAGTQRVVNVFVEHEAKCQESHAKSMNVWLLAVVACAGSLPRRHLRYRGLSLPAFRPAGWYLSAHASLQQAAGRPAQGGEHGPY